MRLKNILVDDETIMLGRCSVVRHLREQRVDERGK